MSGPPETEEAGRLAPAATRAANSRGRLRDALDRRCQALTESEEAVGDSWR